MGLLCSKYTPRQVGLEVHANDEIWTRVLCIHDGCPRNSSRSEPTERGKKQPSHSEIPGGGGVGDHRWNYLYSDRSISVANQRTAATRRPPYGWDTRRAYGWGDVATPDVAAIDAHIQR